MYFLKGCIYSFNRYRKKRNNLELNRVEGKYSQNRGAWVTQSVKLSAEVVISGS